MSKRERVALTLPALILRLALGAIFIWAGAGKLFTTFEVQGEQAAILAGYGVDLPAPTAAAPTTPSAAPLDEPEAQQPDVTETTPGEALDDLGDAIDDAADEVQDTAEDAADEVEDAIDEATDGDDNTLSAAAPNTRFVLVRTAQDSEDDSVRSLRTGGPDGATTSDEPAEDTTITTTPEPQYTAADFPEPREVRSLHHITQMLHDGANPGINEDGSARMALVPGAVAQKPWIVYLAWAAALTELIAGGLLVIGLLTRLSAFSLTGVMIVALWLGTIGPAIQSGNAILGFLPNIQPWNSMEWIGGFFFPVLTFASVLALFLLGPGGLSIDGILFGRRRDDNGAA